MKKKKKQYTLSDYILLGVFLVLLVVVIILVIKLVNVKSTNVKSDFTIPIVDKKLDTTITVDLKELKDERKDYILTLKSFYGNNVLKEDVNYTLTFKNKSSATIKVFKNESDKNLANGKEFTIKDTFKSKKKTIDNYKIKVSGNIKEGDTLDIRVSSK